MQTSTSEMEVLRKAAVDVIAKNTDLEAALEEVLLTGSELGGTMKSCALYYCRPPLTVGLHRTVSRLGSPPLAQSPLTESSFHAVCLHEVEGIVDSCARALGQPPAALATQMLAKALGRICQDDGATQLLGECRVGGLNPCDWSVMPSPLLQRSVLHLLSLGGSLQASLLIDTRQLIAAVMQVTLLHPYTCEVSTISPTCSCRTYFR